MSRKKARTYRTLGELIQEEKELILTIAGIMEQKKPLQKRLTYVKRRIATKRIQEKRSLDRKKVKK